MNTLATFLMSISGSIAARVLLSLGIGIFSYTAFNTLASNVVTQVTNNYNATDLVVLNLLNLAGAGEALGILLAAMVSRASLMAIKKMRPI
jgi:hypothetical protein